MDILSVLKSTYYPLNTLEISKENLLYNYKYLTSLAGLPIAPVLKSNAYGHGLVQVAKVLDNVGAPFLCVDSLHEAYLLYKAKIKTPILIMGYVESENLRVKKLPFSYAMYEERLLEAIKKYQPYSGIHIFVDTGMHREGIPLPELKKFVQKAQGHNLSIEGLMSHFAMANKPKSQETIQQVTNFIKAREILASLNIFPKYVHIAATSGVLNWNTLTPALSLQDRARENKEGDLINMGRVGIGLYGIDPEGKNNELKPVLTLKTKIIQIKHIKKEEKVGYDFTYTVKRDMKIAILPIGYNDGVNRKLSNTGFVKLGKVFCPIVGRVSMNITIIDVSTVRVRTGDEVIVYSNNPKDRNSIQHIAKLCDVIPYEILVQLHSSTKRIIV